MPERFDDEDNLMQDYYDELARQCEDAFAEEMEREYEAELAMCRDLEDVDDFCVW